MEKEDKIKKQNKIYRNWLAYKDDLYKFCVEVLGYKDMNPEHLALCQFLQGEGNSKLVLMPRYTFKSSICTIGYSLWSLLKNQNLRILIYSDAATKAQGFLRSIKDHIEGQVSKSEFRERLGEWETDPKGGKWNESQILINPKGTSFPEPTVDTGGIETSKIGFHYDIIIFDDIVSDLNVTTKEQMDKVADCYKRSLSLLVPGGKIIITGTRWHFGDLYGRLLAENTLRENFQIFVTKAEKDGEYPYASIGLNKDFLTRQRKEQGSYIFSCLYLNSPVDDESAVFRTADFSFYGDVKKTDLYITATCDPAGKGEDMTAITVVGTDHKLDMYILDIVNAKLQPSEIINEILRLHNKYTFRMFGIEENFFRGMLRMELDRQISDIRKEKDFKLFGIVEFTAGSGKGESKEVRIRGLQPYHERGALKFPGERVELLRGAFSELAFQMIQFPKAPHDDIVDALAYHLPLIKRGGVAKKAELPENTPAWLERRWFEKQLEKNNNLPRRWRKKLPSLAFS